MSGRGRAALAPLPRQAAREDDDRDLGDAARGVVRARKRRARIEGPEVHVEDGPAPPELPHHARRRRVLHPRGRRRRRAAHVLDPEGPRGRRQAHVREDARDGEALRKALRREIPVEQVRPDRRERLHLRRHGEHDRDDALRAHAARRARGDRHHERRPHRARARAPMVRRLRHVPRLVRGLAERGLRDVHGAHVAREGSRPRRVRVRAPQRSRGVHVRGERALSPGDRVPGLRLAARSVRSPPLRKGRARPSHAPHGARRRRVLARHP